jgi:hypothetical protein
MIHSSVGIALDAAVWLGQAGDVGHFLGGFLREQYEQLFDGNAAGGGDATDGRCLTLTFVVLAKEPEDLPVGASVSWIPICAASVAARSSFHSLGSVRNPSSLTWIW